MNLISISKKYIKKFFSKSKQEDKSLDNNVDQQVQDTSIIDKLRNSKISQMDQVKEDYENYFGVSEYDSEIELNLNEQNADVDHISEESDEHQDQMKVTNSEDVFTKNTDPFEYKSIEIAEPEEFANAADIVENDTDEVYREIEDQTEDQPQQSKTDDEFSTPIESYSIVDDEDDDMVGKNKLIESEVEEEKKQGQDEDNDYYNAVDKEAYSKFLYEEKEDDTSEYVDEPHLIQPSLHEISALRDDDSSEDKVEFISNKKEYPENNKDRKIFDGLSNIFGVQNKKLLPYFYSFAFVLFLAVFATSYSIFRIEERGETENISESIDNSVQGISDTNYRDENRIGYISNYNVWLVDSDGSNKVQITKDGDKYSTYENITWRKNGILSFDRCSDNKCTIYSYEIETEEIFEDLSISTSRIVDFKWSGDSLYINYVEPNGNLEVIKNTDGNEKVLYEYKISNSGITKNEQVEVVIDDVSPNIILVNNNADILDPEIIIMNENLEIISEIAEDTAYPVFIDEDRLLFKKDDSLYLGNLNSIYSELVISEFGFDLDVSTDSNLISYWTREDTQSYTYIFDFDQRAIMNKLENISEAKWLDDSKIVGFQNTSLNDLDVNQLISYDIELDRNYQIVLDAVSEFEIE